MSGSFDSTVAVFDLSVSSVATNAAAAATAVSNVVAPYDLEIVGVGLSTSGTAPAGNAAGIWFNINAGGTDLYFPPAQSFALATAKLDQSIVTVVSSANAAVVSPTPSVATTSSTITVATTSVAIGQGLGAATGVPVGTRVTSIGAGTVTLNNVVTVSTSAAVTFFKSPTPVAGQAITIASVTNNAAAGTGGVSANFFSVLNGDWVVLASEHSATVQTIKIGPIKQSALYDTTTGFWKFTTDKVNLTAGTLQITEAPLLPNGSTSKVYGNPDAASPFVSKGTVISATVGPVNALGESGATAATGAMSAAVNNLTANIVVRKV